MLSPDVTTLVTMEHAFSAPLATHKLADLGTCIIKMEHTDTILSALDLSTEKIAELCAEAVG